MSVKINKVSLLAALIMGASAASFSTNALAVSCSGADAGNATVSTFRNNPASVLNSADLASAIQLIAVTDSELLDEIIAMARGANADQQKAIGEGLGQAASACVSDQAAYAAQIQSEADGVGGPLQTAFSDASDTGDAEPGDPTETAAVGNQTITPAAGPNTGTGGTVGGAGNAPTSAGLGTRNGASAPGASSPGSTSPNFSSTGASRPINVSPST